ncbi:jg20868 [Pararge aegeria aegeria]|uniref:Jg20868 protein n=1 Tax=Pararge aegeria aegeria TaxID=348720 RepID=A0A8S4R183_9NEOP|nr:jg20868 [Pararge aegeria aegeria]
MRRSLEEPVLHSSTNSKAKVAMGGAHSSGNGMTLGSQGAGMAAPHCSSGEVLLLRLFLPPIIAVYRSEGIGCLCNDLSYEYVDGLCSSLQGLQ